VGGIACFIDKGPLSVLVSRVVIADLDTLCSCVSYVTGASLRLVNLLVSGSGSNIKPSS
jgi:hypothetical protein